MLWNLFCNLINILYFAILWYYHDAWPIDWYANIMSLNANKHLYKGAIWVGHIRELCERVFCGCKRSHVLWVFRWTNQEFRNIEHHFICSWIKSKRQRTLIDNFWMSILIITGTSPLLLHILAARVVHDLD